MAATVVGGTLAAGGANAINMVVDRDIDAVMRRTRGRPLVTGVVSPARRWSLPSSSRWWPSPSCGLRSICSSAVLAVSATLFYVFVYTLWLKRTSRQNIVIGGAAGRRPGAGRLGGGARQRRAGRRSMLFALMFVWTPPHFWALAIRYREDYRSAKVPMMPAVTSFKSTAAQILGLLGAGRGGVVGVRLDRRNGAALLGDCASVLGVVFCGLGRRSLWRDPSEARAMRLFHWSITYVTLLFGAMAVDQLIFH